MRNESPIPAPPPVIRAVEDNTVAILSYLTPIGLIVAAVLHGKKWTQVGEFHLRQMLGLIITTVVFSFPLFILALIPLVNLLGALLLIMLMITLFMCWINGLMAAADNLQTPIPVIGPWYQKWFANAF